MEIGFCFALARCGGISVGRVLFFLVLEIMLSGPRLLLSALALGMCILGLFWWIRQSCLSFVCFCLPLGFGFVISVCLFRPVGSAGVEGHRLWTGVEGDVLIVCFSFVTVGRWVLGRPLNGVCWSLLELFLWCSPRFLVLVLPTVYSAQ